MSTATQNADPASLVYPLTFDPIFKDYVWGGRNLSDQLGREIPDGIVAESWEIAAHPDGSSVVNRGPLAGLSLPEVQARLGEALVGRNNQRMLELERFPLLIKLLDANRWLSVQVHPDDVYGLEHENDLGKTEMWVVLYAEPGAELIYGFKAGVTKDAFEAAIQAGDVEPWLHRVPVEVGDVIFVPAGTIHALGPGAIVAEIQQNSNTTYRIYDWGRPRPIHVEQALDVLNFDLVEPEPLRPSLLNEGDGVRVELHRSLPLFRDPATVFAAGFLVQRRLQRRHFRDLGRPQRQRNRALGRRSCDHRRRRLGAAAGRTGRVPHGSGCRERSVAGVDAVGKSCCLRCCVLRKGI